SSRDAPRHRARGKEVDQGGHSKAALAAFQEAAALEQSSMLAHCLAANILKELGRYEEAVAEFEQVRPSNAAKQAMARDATHGPPDVGLAESLLAAGRFADSSACARRALQNAELRDVHRNLLERVLDISERLTPVAADVPKFLAGTKQPSDAATHLLLGEWLYRQRRCAASARCYQAALAKPATDLGSHRYYAACAAALAGCGNG